MKDSFGLPIRTWRDEVGVWESYYATRRPINHDFEPNPDRPIECKHCGNRREAHRARD